jgi:hypothetical protein
VRLENRADSEEEEEEEEAGVGPLQLAAPHRGVPLAEPMREPVREVRGVDVVEDCLEVLLVEEDCLLLLLLLLLRLEFSCPPPLRALSS